MGENSHQCANCRFWKRTDQSYIWLVGENGGQCNAPDGADEPKILAYHPGEDLNANVYTKADFYCSHHQSPQEPSPVQPPAKPVKLNLGCQEFHQDGWVNVDIVPEFKPDLLDDCTVLSKVEENSVDDIYAGHLLEHVSDPVGVLRIWLSKLKPGGILAVTVPDFEKSVQLWQQGQSFVVGDPLTSILAVATGFYGYADYLKQGKEQAKFQTHRQGFSPATLKACMELAGFVDLQQLTYHPAMVAAVDWQVCVMGVKG